VNIQDVSALVALLAAAFAAGKWGTTWWRAWRRPRHPEEMRPGVGPNRGFGPLQPCSFQIADDFSADQRWNGLADVKVVILGARLPRDTRVYLIPSGDVPRPLRYPQVLRNDQLALETKRGATMRFATKNAGARLRGFKFDSERGFPMIYCRKYDGILRKTARRYLKT
jgi:hypothetical protein